MADELMTVLDAKFFGELPHYHNVHISRPRSDRILATYHAHARLVADNAELRERMEWWRVEFHHADTRAKTAIQNATMLRDSLAEAQKDVARWDAVRDNSWTLEPFAMPTAGGDDCDIGWKVSEIHERNVVPVVVGRVYVDDPRAAIDAAMQEGK